MGSTEPQERPPRLLIGLPVYNGENYVEQAIESILAQSFTDFELLISDNASTDGTRAICEAFAARDRRVRYHRHPQNIGAAPNFNWVVHQCRSAYFRWAAHDDVLGPDYLKSCVDALEASPGAVVAHTLTARIGENNENCGHFEAEAIRGGLRPSDRLRWILWTPEYTDMFGVIRTEVLKRTALQGSYSGSDRNFMGELLLHGDMALVPRYEFFRRDHPEAFSRVVAASKSGARLEALWFNPRAKLPGWTAWIHRLWCYLVAAWRSPIEPGEKLRCTYVLLERGWRRALWRVFRIGHKVPTGFCPGSGTQGVAVAASPFVGRPKRRSGAGDASTQNDRTVNGPGVRPAIAEAAS